MSFLPNDEVIRANVEQKLIWFKNWRLDPDLTSAFEKGSEHNCRLLSAIERQKLTDFVTMFTDVARILHRNKRTNLAEVRSAYDLESMDVRQVVDGWVYSFKYAKIDINIKIPNKKPIA